MYLLYIQTRFQLVTTISLQFFLQNIIMVCFALLSFSAKISCILKIHGFYSLYKAKVYLHNQSAVTYVIEKSKEEAIIFIGNHVYLYEIGIFYLKILHFNRIRNKTVSSNTKYSLKEKIILPQD